MPALTPRPLTQKTIKEYLPHRDPMLFLDGVETWEPHKTLTAHYTPHASNPVFGGHFPGQPIWPGVLMVEGMAQAAALLVGLSNGYKSTETTYLFRKVEGVEFKAVVTPGQTLIYRVRQSKAKLGFFTFSGTVEVEGTPIATATFTAKLVFNG